MREKAAAAAPPVTDCSCKNASEAAEAEGEKLIAKAKQESEAALKGLTDAAAALDADLASATAKIEELNNAAAASEKKASEKEAEIAAKVAAT